MMRTLYSAFALIFATSWSQLSMAQISHLDVKDLQGKIEAAGADWQAEDNGFEVPMYDNGLGATVFGLIESEVEKNHKGGWIPRSRTRIAPRLDWRDHNGHNWLPPIRNQGQCGSCTSFAAIGLMETQLNIAAGEPQMNIDLSEQYLFTNTGKCSSGSMPGNAMSSLRYTGVPDEVCHPYLSGRMGENQTMSSACTDRTKRSYRLNSYQSVAPYNFKWALQYGPVLTTMMVYEDFKYYKSGVYKHVSGSLLGGHAVLLVGYDDNLQAWIARNSWSERWGEKGYFLISYNSNSQFGLSGYRGTVARPAPYTKITSPGGLSAIQGMTTFAIKEHGYSSQNISQYTANLSAYQREFALNFDVGMEEMDFDLSREKDGLYTIKMNNMTLSAIPSYSQVVIANQKPELNVVVKPDFDISKPVSGKQYFEILASYKEVPPTSSDIYFYNVDGSVVGKTTIPNPGGKSKFSWYTQKVPNGQYSIKAVHHVGKLYSFESEKVEFEIYN